VRSFVLEFHLSYLREALDDRSRGWIEPLDLALLIYRQNSIFLVNLGGSKREYHITNRKGWPPTAKPLT
jgi:hypothetical protein